MDAWVHGCMDGYMDVWMNVWLGVDCVYLDAQEYMPHLQHSHFHARNASMVGQLQSRVR
jgi:hypothetical protein